MATEDRGRVKTKPVPEGYHAVTLFIFARGMTILELDGRFPPDADLDAAWASGLQSLESRAGRSDFVRLRKPKAPGNAAPRVV